MLCRFTTTVVVVVVIGMIAADSPVSLLLSQLLFLELSCLVGLLSVKLMLLLEKYKLVCGVAEVYIRRSATAIIV